MVGQVSGVPIQWIYYQLAFDESRRVTCVFTMGGQDVEAFGAEDITLVNQLDLRPNASVPERELAAVADETEAR